MVVVTPVYPLPVVAAPIPISRRTTGDELPLEKLVAIPVLRRMCSGNVG
jgi:hypothetical protein